jgi:hypothetical protein
MVYDIKSSRLGFGQSTGQAAQVEDLFAYKISYLFSLNKNIFSFYR